MFGNLTNTTIDEASEEDVLAAMGGNPDDDDSKGKKPNGKKPSKSVEAKTGTSTKGSVSDIAKSDLNAAFSNEDDDDDDEDDDENEDDLKPKKKVSKKVETEDDADDDDSEDDSDDDADDDDSEDDDTEDQDDDDDDDDDEDDDAPVGVADFLKARVQLLLAKGEWKPFDYDGKKPDEVEWTEEMFEEIELQQRAWIKESMKEELLDTFGPYGRDIAQYAANGGNPEDLIDIFKEQQAVSIIDISTEEGQKEMVYQYQTQILKRSPERAKKEIERSIADKLLEEDAIEAKDTIESHLKEEADRLKKEAEDQKREAEKRAKENQQRFVKDVTEIVNTSDDILPDEKKEILRLLTSFRHELPNGVKVNDFYHKLADFRKDLRNYINMVRFVNNPEKFIKSLKNQGKTAEANKSFSLARGASSKKKLKASQQIDSSSRSPKKTGFRLL